MNKKLLVEVNQTWEAELISNALDRSGIPFEVSQKAKEYSSIISGIDSISIDIFVDEMHFFQATELLKQLASHSAELQSEEPLVKNHFRRVIIFSVIGVILLPLIFNLVATFSYAQMKEQKVTSGERLFALIVLILGWIMACCMLLFILHD